MELASEKETLGFLNSLFFRWGQQIIARISLQYTLTEEQKEALEEVFLRPNDWTVYVKPPLHQA
jgi:hypothetical protein